MSENMKPGNIAANLNNIIATQKEVAKEKTTSREVKEKISKPVVYEPKDEIVKKDDSLKTIFKGFQYSDMSQSKVETYLPLANVTLRQTPFLFQDELSMAQTIIQEKDVLFDILQMTYKHILEGPVELTKSFESFVENLFESDVDALLYGQYLCTYGPIIKPPEKFLICSTCGTSHIVEEINLTSICTEESYSGKEWEAKNLEVELDLTDHGIKGAKFYLKFPTMKKYLSAKNLNKKDALKDIIGMSVRDYVSKIEFNNQIFTDSDSILNAVNTLNTSARKLIRTAIEEKFIKYGLKFIYKWVCKNKLNEDASPNEKLFDSNVCNKENEKRITINELFFRKILESVS